MPLYCPDAARPGAPLPHGSVIVVLGSDVEQNGLLNIDSDERVIAGAEAWRAGAAPLVVFTGGTTKHPISFVQATVMAGRARSLGVPASAELEEGRSQTTHENACFTAALLRERGVPLDAPVVVVTEPYHLRRAVAIFARCGLAARPWPIARSYAYAGTPYWRLRLFRQETRESLAWVKAWALGWV